MDKREILQRIIDDKGDCEALVARSLLHLCKTCPMSKLKTRPDGTYLGCWESLLGDLEQDNFNLKEGIAHSVYLEKAIELLADIVMEDILEREPLAEETRRDTPEDN